VPIFPVPCGQFAGMTQAALQALLAQAQQALFQIQLGAKPQTLSYAQADGSKSVSYTPTSREGLMTFIRQINGALGQSGRRPIGVVFR
jgi:hypothetical protein